MNDWMSLASGRGDHNWWWWRWQRSYGSGGHREGKLINQTLKCQLKRIWSQWLNLVNVPTKTYINIFHFWLQ